MKHALKWKMPAIGAAMALGGYALLASAQDLSNRLIPVHVPSTQTDNPVFALPLYLIGVLVQFGALLFIKVAGIALVIAGLIFLIITLVRWLRTRGKPLPPPLP
ncbi:MAG: hypothetical protein D4R65_05740 [Verrucomicrobiaceae bacterium]|nr:MAG: hypothetical protein D4R65_05740 [Verrucomicrobiaceae bacterium]